MEIVAPFGNLVGAVGNAIQNGHVFTSEGDSAETGH
jgi:hypothetical protein